MTTGTLSMGNKASSRDSWIFAGAIRLRRGVHDSLVGKILGGLGSCAP